MAISESIVANIRERSVLKQNTVQYETNLQIVWGFQENARDRNKCRYFTQIKIAP